MKVRQPLEHWDALSESETAGTMVDRRRPGRPKTVSPNLIPLLRGEASPDIEPPPLVIEKDDVANLPMAGIACGMVLSIPLWALIGGVVHLLT